MFYRIFGMLLTGMTDDVIDVLIIYRLWLLPLSLSIFLSVDLYHQLP